MSSVETASTAIRSTIPARLDRLEIRAEAIELLIGIKAEGRSLEEITKPLTSTDTSSPAEPAPSPA